MTTRAPSATSSTPRSTPTEKPAHLQGEAGRRLARHQLRRVPDARSKRSPWACARWGSPTATGWASSPRTGRSGPTPTSPRSARRALDVPIYATLLPSQVLYILNDSEARVCFVSTAAQARKVAGGAGARPRPWSTWCSSTRSPSKGTHVPGRAAGQGPGGPRQGPGRGAGAGRGGEARGPRHPHLHLGHHRRPQGRDAHPREPGLERPGRQRALRGHWGPTTPPCPSCPSATSSSAWAATT